MYSHFLSCSCIPSKSSVKVNLLHVAAGINETEWQQIFTVNSESRILREDDPIGNFVADKIVDVSESYF